MIYCEQCDYKPADNDEEVARQLQSELEQNVNSP